ncbi:MAG: ferrous iron transport protein B [Puniceicoccales bacterium]|jgi:ferrous iron transport protein B|nr:ferrous iron transport protein B [Puniceicoccales bacterium]
MKNTPERPPLVAILGNPNTGKSTIFNALTGLRQRIGNYPGVTISKTSGSLKISGVGRVELLDLPGLYSLAAASLDERIVIDALCGRLPGTPIPDALVCVADATNLRRHLFLVLQAAELGIPLMLVLNHADIVEKRGIRIDAALLSRRLGGIPVALVSARRGGALDDVRDGIAKLILEKPRMEPLTWKPCVAEALQILDDGLARETSAKVGQPCPLSGAELQRLLFDTATPVLDHVPCPAETIQRLIRAARELVRRGGYNPLAAESVLHYERIASVLKDAVTDDPGVTALTRSIDRVLLHRVFGALIFFALMVVVFLAVFSLASIPQDWIGAGVDWLKDAAGGALEGSPVLQSLATDGIIAGVGAFLVFLPQILILFFFIALLEDSGYMARAAFLMDKLFAWCGLNGKCFVPMLSGYACAVPGVLATRTIEDPKARLATIFLVPFMSCSARLPVYTLMIAAFVTPLCGEFYGGLAMLAMYLAGLAVAVPAAWVLTRFVLKTRPQPFLLELPRYEMPKPHDVLWRVWQSGFEFVKRAGTIIFAITVIVWALLYFPHDDAVEEQVKKEFAAEQAQEAGKTPAAVATAATAPVAVEGAAAAEAPADDADDAAKAEADALKHRTEAAHIGNSYLGRFGKFAQPIFAPAGFDWKITIGILASFPAREVIVSTLGITYSLGGEVEADDADLKTSLAKSVWADGVNVGKPIFTLPVVFGIMLFFALCSQCGATLSVIAKEAGWRWAAASFVFMTTLAWVAAVACFQIGSLLT